MRDKSAPLFLFSLLLFACAPTRYPAGLDLLQGKVPAFATPDSLRADVEVFPGQPRGAFAFSARLYAKPLRRYRLDGMGFSSVAATYTWDSGQWTLLLHQSREAISGQGDSLALPAQGLRLPDVHAALGFLWGQPLPGLSARDSGSLEQAGDTLRWKARGVAWWARLDPKTGACLEANSDALGLRYGAPRRFGSLYVPERVEVSSHGRLMLALKVNKVEENPAWKKNPFAVAAPEGYRRHSPELP